MNVFRSNRVAVGLFEALDQFTERHFRASEIVACVKNTVEVGLVEAKTLQCEAWVERLLLRQGVKGSDRVTDRAISVDQADSARLLSRVTVH